MISFWVYLSSSLEYLSIKQRARSFLQILGNPWFIQGKHFSSFTRNDICFFVHCSHYKFLFCSSLIHVLNSPNVLSMNHMLFPMLVPFNVYTPVLTRLCSVVLLFVLVFSQTILQIFEFSLKIIFSVSLSAHVALFVHFRAAERTFQCS